MRGNQVTKWISENAGRYILEKLRFVYDARGDLTAILEFRTIPNRREVTHRVFNEVTESERVVMQYAWGMARAKLDMVNTQLDQLMAR
jgi:hypothetical protein